MDWNKLPEPGMKGSLHSSLFVKKVGNQIAILLLYVGDIIITGSAIDSLQQVISSLTA